jgi:hypothetical protein
MDETDCLVVAVATVFCSLDDLDRGDRPGCIIGWETGQRQEDHRSQVRSIRDVVAWWSRHRAGNRLIVSSNPTSARLWLLPCGVAWDAVSKPMVEYIDPEFRSMAWAISLAHQAGR